MILLVMTVLICVIREKIGAVRLCVCYYTNDR